MDDKSTAPQRVRFEEVTPANEPAAFLNVDLDDLVAPLKLPIYDGYDGLDEMRFAYLTLPSGETVVLGAYLTCPQPGTDLYIDEQLQHSAQIVFEACQYLNLDRSTIAWFHPDFREEIDLLYTNKPINLKPQISSQIEGLVLSYRFEPIDCFNHAISIYNRERFPKYWAMLQRNLGLAYSNRMEGDRQENLKRSVECFNHSLEIHTLEKFPDQNLINNQDLAKTKELLNRLNHKIPKIEVTPLTGIGLLQKIKELSNLPRKEIAKHTGYYRRFKNGKFRVNLTGFYEAVLIAKGVSLNSNYDRNGRDSELGYKITVNKNGQIIIGSAYTKEMGLTEGDEFEIKLGYKHIHLIQTEALGFKQTTLRNPSGERLVNRSTLNV